MSAKRYISAVTVILLLLSLLIVAFNRVVDPFWYYRDVSIDGFNAIKPKFHNFERHVKPLLVQRIQPNSLIFGSSYAEIGFDPLHPALSSTGKSYNFALAGAQWEMVSCDVLFALSEDSALHQIVLGIHPQAMPLKDCKADIAKMEAPNRIAFLFSSDAFKSSISTVLEQNKQEETHTKEGLYLLNRGHSGTAGRFSEVFAKYFKPCKIDKVSSKMPSAHQPNQANLDLKGLREIVHKAVERGITLKLVVYPRHALTFEQEYQCGTRQARYDALAQIVSLVEAERSNLVEVWDFEVYHTIGTETISDAPSIYWQDNAHFNTEFGNLMLDEMFDMKQPKFGVRLTSLNLKTREAKEINDRETYLREHPEFLQQLESLLPQHAN